MEARSIPARFVAVALLIALLLAALGWLLWYLAYELSEAPPEQVRVAGLAHPAVVGWDEGGAVTIGADTEADAYLALGFAHGTMRPFSVLQWRQVARGRLAAWYGDEVLGVDRLSLQLRLMASARKAYEALSPEDRGLLTAYTSGLNAALSTDYVQRNPTLLSRRWSPTEWEPWEPLALERLFAWLAAPLLNPASPDTTVRALARADSLLRNRLQLHGFEHSMAVVLTDSMTTTVYQRHVYGATTPPLLLPVTIALSGAPFLSGGSLPGTPFFPAGKTETHIWAKLLATTARWRRESSSPATTRHAVLYRRDGSEVLLSVHERPGALLALEDDSTPAPDSLWALYWSGFSEPTDWHAWRDLVRGKPPTFRLFSGSGVLVTADGTRTLLPASASPQRLPGGLLLGHPQWAELLAGRLAELHSHNPAHRFDPEWMEDRYSTWAARLLPRLLEAFNSTATLSAREKEALSYLRNWNFRYDRSSIAASIFDTWVRSALPLTGTTSLPSVSAGSVDTTLFSDALSSLARRFGSDESKWRWETVQARRVYAADWAGVGDVPTYTYPGEGHPTTLFWGPSAVFSPWLSTEAWEAWTSLDPGSPFFVRQTDPPGNRFSERLARQVKQIHLELPSPDPAPHRTHLIPDVH